MPKMINFIKKLNSKINNWLDIRVPKLKMRRMQDCFAFKDDQEMDEIYDEILEERRVRFISNLKKLLLLYILVLAYFILCFFL